MLTLAALDVFEPRWSPEILHELARNVLADNPGIDPARWRTRTLGAMRAAFPNAEVTAYESFLDEADNHPKDRHVAAAAMACGAKLIVTDNLRDFRGRALPARGIVVESAAAFLARTADEEPAPILLALDEMAARKTRPPLTVEDILTALDRQPNLRRFTAWARSALQEAYSNG